MSCYIVLNSWDGEDQDTVAEKVGRMFKMEEAQASGIFETLLGGHSWQFENQISDQQAEIAKNFLNTLGFEVELSPLDIESAEPIKDFGPEIPFGFHGTGGQLFMIMLKNWILTILTLGIYYFWGKTKERKFYMEQTSFAGDRFSYHGTGKELFVGFLKLLVIIAIVGAGFYYGEKFLGEEVVTAIAVVLYFIVFPILMVGAWRYRLTRTAWRGIRFSFRGERKAALGIFLKAMILTPLTLGLYTPAYLINWQKFMRGEAYFGNLKFQFEGRWKEIFWRTFWAAFLIPLTLYLYLPWYVAWLQRYQWSKTEFAGATFKFTATGGQLFGLWIVNYFLLILTAGLGYPWVQTRNMNFLVQHLSLEGDINLNNVVQDMQKGGAIGEGALDAFDVPLDVF